MKKRILIFSLMYYPLPVGGAEVAIKEITDRLSSEYDFDIVTLKKTGTLRKYLFPITGFWEALTLSHTNRYDAIWSMMASYNAFAALFFKLTHPTIPFILTLQEGDPIAHIKNRARPVWPLFKMIFTKATIVQTISHFLADFARDMQVTCPIEVIPNGVDVKLFSQETVPPFEKKKGEIYLITTSRLVVKNGVGDIITALTHLPEHIKLLILGTGELEKSLKEKVHVLNLNHRVSFLGFIPYKEIPKYLHISDIFIRPSLSEGFGNSFIEAMAAGLPVIATPVGGIVDFVIDGKTGLFCEVHNPRSIADQVELIIHDPKLHKKLITNGYMMVRDTYDWNLVADQMKAKIFSIL